MVGGGGAPLAQWAVFGVALLLALISPYVSSLLFGILVTLRINGEQVPLLRRAQQLLQGPVTWLLAAAFLYVAFFVAFAPYFAKRSEDAVAQAMYTLLLVVELVWVLMAAIWAAWRVRLLIVEATAEIMRHLRVPPFSRPLVQEACTLVVFVLFVVLVVWLVFNMLSLEGRCGTSSNVGTSHVCGTLDQLSLLLTGLNWFTMSLVLGLTPFLRDVVAGLSLFADGLLSPRALVRVVDVSQVGYVAESRLRVLLLRNLDQSLAFVPNSKLLRYPLISYSAATLTVCEITMPLAPAIPPARLRRALVRLQRFVSALRRANRRATSQLAPHAQAAQAAPRLGRRRASSASSVGSVASSIASAVPAAGAAGPGHVAGEGGAAARDAADPFTATLDGDGALVVRFAFQQKGTAATKRAQSQTLLQLTELLEEEGVELSGPSRTLYRSLSPGRSAPRLYTD